MKERKNKKDKNRKTARKSKKGPNLKLKKNDGKPKIKKIKIISKKNKIRSTSGEVRYCLNPQFQYIDELKDLILKSSPGEKEKMINNLHRLGRVKLAITTGIFLNKVNAEAMATDLFIVMDDINRRKLRSFLKSLEADIGKEIKYVVMEKEEFHYRIGMFDRFIRVLLEGPHEKLINKLGI